ncbi:MAG: four helix bundle protein [Planctomycetaceae bacterium]|nr:four helix bundle protein [Planctomycetaceae bacterium]
MDELSRSIPRDETFGLTSPIGSAAVSVPSKIAALHVGRTPENIANNL